MKVLVVVDESTRCIGDALGKVLGLADHEVVITNHEKAIATFLNEEPSATIIWDYSEKWDGAKGCGTYKDIKASAMSGQKVIRCGLDTYEYPDYVRAPFRIGEIFEKIS